MPVFPDRLELRMPRCGGVICCHLSACRAFNAVRLQLEVSEGGTINASALKQIVAGGDGVGLRTYDPG